MMVVVEKTHFVKRLKGPKGLKGLKEYPLFVLLVALVPLVLVIDSDFSVLPSFPIAVATSAIAVASTRWRASFTTATSTAPAATTRWTFTAPLAFFAGLNRISNP